jgi:hypothetical protein
MVEVRSLMPALYPVAGRPSTDARTPGSYSPMAGSVLLKRQTLKERRRMTVMTVWHGPSFSPAAHPPHEAGALYA